MYYNYSDLNYINQELNGVWPGWTAVRLLGRGAFGAVYEIQRNVRGNLEKAAMKVLRVPENDAEIARLQFQGMNYQSTDAYYEDLVDGIQNEIRIMQRFVGNSHIVSYEDYAIRKRYNQVGWDLYIRMELLNSMTDYMKRSAFSEHMVIKMGMDIAQGLRDCHNSKIIHRDVKPENIFVNGRGDFKLGDFGVSRTAPGSQSGLSFKGTLDYMAPEVYRMLSTDARSDIYSLGMVLYQCLNSNRLPFVPEHFTSANIENARMRRFAGEQFPYPEHGSRGLQNIVLKATAVRPEDRFQTAEEMYRALQYTYVADYGGNAAIYQNTARQAYDQRPTSVNYYNSPAERNNIAAAPQGQQYPNQYATNQYVQGQFAQDQYTQYQPVDSKPFPLIPILAAVVIMLMAIASAGIFSQLRRGTVNSDPGEEVQEDVAEVVKEQNEEPVEEEFTDYAIDWRDVALEKKMRKITKISSRDIMYSDVKDITRLDLAFYHHAGEYIQIQDISALSNLTNLTELDLGENQISDISALGGLTNLTILALNDNRINDISALSNLTNLRFLDLSLNQISDINALRNLTNLAYLNIRNNQIDNYSPIEDLDIDELFK